MEGPWVLHRTLRFDCRYTNEFGERDIVRIDFYIGETQFLSDERALAKSPFVETHPAIVRAYSLEDLMARKLITLYNRTEGKDIYDVFYSLDLEFDGEKFDRALNIMLDLYGLDHFPEKLLVKLREARKNVTYIGNSTNHFIPRDLRPDWRMFIDTLIAKLERKLSWE